MRDRNPFRGARSLREVTERCPVLAPVRSVRSLPEGRSLTLRERERCEGSGLRSSPHPGEPQTGALEERRSLASGSDGMGPGGLEPPT